MTFFNSGASGNITLNQGSGVTLVLAGTGSIGDRIVGPLSVATAVWINSGSAFVSGAGVS